MVAQYAAPRITRRIATNDHADAGAVPDLRTQTRHTKANAMSTIYTRRFTITTANLGEVARVIVHDTRQPIGGLIEVHVIRPGKQNLVSQFYSHRAVEPYLRNIGSPVDVRELKSEFYDCYLP